MECQINHSLTCNVCSKVLKSKKSLNNHNKTHSEENIQICKQCNKLFNKAGTLKNHVLTHSGKKPYRSVPGI